MRVRICPAALALSLAVFSAGCTTTPAAGPVQATPTRGAVASLPPTSTASATPTQTSARLAPTRASTEPPAVPSPSRKCEYSGTAEAIIKGNIAVDSGEHIYHVPGGEFYANTVINASFGEQWFCTEAEARAAGWRRSLR